MGVGMMASAGNGEARSPVSLANDPIADGPVAVTGAEVPGIVASGVYAG